MVYRVNIISIFGLKPFPINLVKTITHLAVYTELLPVFLYLVFNQKLADKGIRVILFLISFGFLIDLYGLFLINKGQANFLFFNLFNLVETASLLFFFYFILRIRNIKMYVLISFVVFFIVWIYLFTKEGLIAFNDNAVNLEYFIILLFSISFYYNQLKSTELMAPFRNPHFWIVSAYLIYIAGTFFLFLLLNNLSRQEQEQYYVVNFIFLLIKTILLSVAMLQKPVHERKKKFQLT